MFCPVCGIKQATEKARYCKACGLEFGGANKAVSSRKGLEQGAKLIILGILLIPVWMFIGAAFPPEDSLVEASPSTTVSEMIAWIMMWVAFLAGAARIGFAVIFERGVSAETDLIQEKASIPRRRPADALPTGDSFKPVEAGSWKTSGDLFAAVSRGKGASGEL